jgi:phage shock protein PspC (stress-responsive transcriptional regulator)
MNRRSLYRCRHDRRIAGVAAGVAEFFDLDPTIVRLVWLVSIFFGGFGLLLYIVMAIVVPNEPLSEQELAQQVDPESPHRHATAARNDGLGMTFVGIALIVFGGLALANTVVVDWGFSGGFLWPGFILALGVLLVVAALRRGEPEPVQFGEPPVPPAPPAPPATPVASVQTDQ